MPKYLSINLIDAEPMTRGERYSNSGYGPPGEGSNPKEPGFLIHCQYTGRKIWVQKDTFLRSNFKLESSDPEISFDDIYRFRHKSSTYDDDRVMRATAKTLSGFEVNTCTRAIESESNNKHSLMKLTSAKLDALIFNHLKFVLQWAINGLGAQDIFEKAEDIE